ncbi:MAG TPA: 3-hydroxyacyl-CoA dehydrogenase NAD-binding domain-containing protein, partial [Gemmataceae bacterium]|nr:3-hydroxyacyl-CoA dehydrogenase NAD-binding domain-containing protein [Gemmataceae bacterium]
MLYESQNFRLEADDQVLSLWLDFRGRTSHCLTLPILNELSLVLDRVAAHSAADVLLLRTSRPGAFLEEFDVTELARFVSPLEFAALATRGQELVRKLAGLPARTIAIVEGRCAGAGLELVLGCDSRVAVDSPTTRFESPELDRGLVPCWGGSYRLPRRVGLRASLRHLLDGEIWNAREAYRVGLVDQVIPLARLAVDLRTLTDAAQDNPEQSTQFSLRRWWQATASPRRSAYVRKLRRRISAGNEESDVRIALIDSISAGLSSEGEGLSAERAAVTRLASSEKTRRLIELHRHASAPVRVFPDPVNPIPTLPRRVGIVGAGDLSAVLARKLARLGHEVVVQARGPDEAEAFVRSVEPVPTASVRPTCEWVGFENADLVIEAGDEDPGIKRNLFHELERRARPRTILVTAGTTVSVEAIQAELTRRSRVAGLHFPNPNGRHPVAEIVGTATTDPGIVLGLANWCRRWCFTPVRVADRPGRLVMFVWLTYLSEGVSLVAEGLPPDRVDAAFRRFGVERGPLEWCDDVGLDRLAELAAQMQLARGDGFARNLLFHRLLPYGWVGKAGGEGFYRHGWRRRPNELARMALWRDVDEDSVAHYVFDPDAALAEGVERVVLRTVNEAAAALVDEPDADPRTVDLALAFGMGWAAHRGGPLRYADEIGLASVSDRLAYFAERFGRRFTPCDELVRRAEAGESFYGGA